MKLVTEFASFTLTKAADIKAKLAADGKTPEEIETEMGTTFKFEGEKLKHFMNAIEVSVANKTNLKRVLVATLAEGEAAPQKAVKVEESYYIPELLVLTAYVKPEAAGKGGRSGSGRNSGGPRKPSSPWGMSPEEKAAKNKPAAPATPATKPS